MCGPEYFETGGTENIMNDAITTGMLVKLRDQGKVRRCEQPNGRGGWELTREEFERRREDIRFSSGQSNI